MARSVNNAVLDAALNYLADNGSTLHICAGEPTTYAEASGANELGSTALATGDGNDYTIADGDTSGRKVTVAAQLGVNITADGTADHLAITNGTDTLLYVTTITAQAVSNGNTADTSAWDAEIADPTA